MASASIRRPPAGIVSPSVHWTPGDQLEEHELARAVRSELGNGRSREATEVDAIDRGHAHELPSHIGHFEQRIHCLGSVRRDHRQALAALRGDYPQCAAGPDPHAIFRRIMAER